LEEPAGAEIGERLNMSRGEPVYRIVRIRTIDGEPIMYDQVYMPAQNFPGLKDKDLNNRSLYEIIANDYGTALGKARQVFEPVLIDVRESKLLKVDKGTAAMLIERITFDLNGAPVVYSTIIIRGDKCRFSADISVQ
jgi:GntR family transcriptional regulator